MGKFWYMVMRAVREADIVVFVADARLPELSRSAEVEDAIRKAGKVLIFAINKSDLISDAKLDEVKSVFAGESYVLVSAKDQRSISRLREAILIAGKRTKLEDPNVVFVGYPNTGKSSLINALVRRAPAKISPVAGTTRGLQWVSLAGLRILDSPGVIPLDEKDEMKLALLGAVNAERIKQPVKIALKLIIMIGNEAVAKAYGLPVVEDEYDMLMSVGRKKGFVIKGGNIDERKASIALIRDLNDGKLRF